MKSGFRRRPALRGPAVQKLALRALLGCLLFLPLVDLWMDLLSWLVPDAGQPAIVALLLSTLISGLCAWKLPRFFDRLRAAVRPRR